MTDLAPDPITTLRLAALANGYTPVPVTSPDYRHEKLAAPGKAPFFKGWQTISRDTLDEPTIRRWPSRIRNHGNTGLLCGDLVGLDLDVPEPSLAAQIGAMADAMLGTTPLHRVGKAPKSLRAYRAAVPLPKLETAELILDDGMVVQVEAMGVGQQIVAFGTHPATMQPYQWLGAGPDTMPLSDLPVVAEPALRAFLAAAEAVLRQAGGLTKEERKAAADAAAAEAARQPQPGPGSAAQKAKGARKAGDGEFFRQVNTAALGSIGAWFPVIFPSATEQKGGKTDGAWRVSSEAMGRGLEEDLSMHPTEGGQDFGTRQGCSPIDVVMEWHHAPDAKAAALWLCEQLHVAPATLGWTEGKGAQSAPPSATPGAKPEPTRKPQLQVIGSDLPATARAVRDLFANNSTLYDRGGVLVRLAHAADGGPPIAVEVTPNGIIAEAHRLCQPMAWSGDNLKPVTLSERVAKMVLDLRGDWRVPALDGVTTAPVLAGDGTILDRDGYDPSTRLWCAKVPALDLPDHPVRQDAAAALAKLRQAFRTFPFGDSARVTITQDDSSTLSVVDTRKPAGLDETAALAGLLTAVCRPSLHLAPGFLVSAAAISGAGAGKGLLVRAICLTAFGTPPRAFTAGAEKGELDKRLAAELIEATPALFLDNVNGASLKSDLLASVLTERPARVRILGKSLMVPLNSTAFISLTGNGLSVSEDLARRFLSCNLDAQMEDPESRPFAPGYLDRIASARPALLAAALTIWRWGRQNPGTLTRGLRLGSFETWAEWVRDPLLTLGCADPVQRIQDAKASDARRLQVFELFDAWWHHHHDSTQPIKKLHDDVREIADPASRGRQYLATFLDKLTGTRAAGFVLVQHKPQGKWGTTRFALKVTDQEVVNARAKARREADVGQDADPGPQPDDIQEPGYWPE